MGTSRAIVYLLATFGIMTVTFGATYSAHADDDPPGICVMYCDGDPPNNDSGGRSERPSLHEPSEPSQPQYSTPQPQYDPAADAQEKLNAAIQTYDSGDIDGAIQWIKQCLAILPDSVACQKWSAFLDIRLTLQYHARDRLWLQWTITRLRENSFDREPWVIHSANALGAALCSVCDSEMIDGSLSVLDSSDVPSVIQKQISGYGACTQLVTCGYSRSGLGLFRSLKRCQAGNPALLRACSESALEAAMIPLPDSSVDRARLNKLESAIDRATRTPFCVGAVSCNYFVARIAELLNIPYLRDVMYPRKSPNEIGGRDKDRSADNLYDFMERAVLSPASGWRAVTPIAAQKLADRGLFVIGVAHSVPPAQPQHGLHGHIVVVAPEQMDRNTRNPKCSEGTSLPWVRDAQHSIGANAGSVRANSSFGRTSLNVGRPIWAVWDPGSIK